MKASSLLILAIMVCAGAGCGPLSSGGGSREEAESGGSAQSSTARTSTEQRLRAAADKLARSDLARLSATELLYRNNTYYYTYWLDVVNIESGVYAKLYREFTGYNIADIRRSDSILRPVTIAVEFEYDLVGTKEQISGHADPRIEKVALDDYDFRVVRHETFLTEYTCDENGVPIDEGIAPLDRPNYWDQNDNADRGTFSMKQVGGW